MIRPPVKATAAAEKPPAAKPLSSRWIPDDDPKAKSKYQLQKSAKTVCTKTYKELPKTKT